jgi:hypothetical protein
MTTAVPIWHAKTLDTPWSSIWMLQTHHENEIHGRLHHSMGIPSGYIKWKFTTNNKIHINLTIGYGRGAQILGD